MIRIHFVNFLKQCVEWFIVTHVLNSSSFLHHACLQFLMFCFVSFLQSRWINKHLLSLAYYETLQSQTSLIPLRICVLKHTINIFSNKIQISTRQPISEFVFNFNARIFFLRINFETRCFIKHEHSRSAKFVPSS